jgi:antitoxin (DNA-binding transcriptional repressor) of toxin-antitoxin stability system
MASPPNSLTLQATLVPVGREFTVKPGQYVMIVAGLAVGVYTGDTNVPLVTHDAPSKEEVPHKVSALAARSEGQSFQAKRVYPRPGEFVAMGMRKNGEPVATVIPIVSSLRSIIRERRSVVSTDLMRELDVLRANDLLPLLPHPWAWDVRGR